MIGVFVQIGVLLAGLAIWAALALTESKRIAEDRPRKQPIFRRSSRMILWFVAAVGLLIFGYLLQQPNLIVAGMIAHLAGAIWTGFAPRDATKSD